MSRLERRYRRLLLCYPLAFRRARADEIVGTLLELAPPGRTRPTWPEGFNLVRHGLRARLGRPASRTVVAWAALASVLCGLFAGAVGVRLGWATARPLPTAQETLAAFHEAFPNYRASEIESDVTLFFMTWRPFRKDEGILRGLDTFYQPGATTATVFHAPPLDHQQIMQTAQDSLRAAGWSLYPATPVDTAGCATCQQTGEPRRYTMSATREDIVLILEVEALPTASADLSVSLGRTTPWPVYPAGIVIGLLAAAAGWMVFGWASRRTQNRMAVQVMVTFFYTIAMLAWIFAVTFGVSSALPRHLSTPRPRWDPMWEWVGLSKPAPLVLFLIGSVCALLALALAALPRLRTRQARQGATA
ncbi:hypothetical protein Rhe02_63770 [Rhizocola hellebori]|uniref:Uncharacterized protein n=1 Tax=Rhizocola hellebori TaxID=1392758 RepID=A0A8J3QCW3_9ACTN|nr:hypothetical protein [Rhizocola hellebori]GIH08310.1 hypothetical protein Rhe02_63770 [Rhizocola hellebori]